MKKLTESPEIVAAIVTVIGTLLVSMVLGFVEGRIGLEALLALVALAALVLLVIWLHKRVGTTKSAVSVLAMVIIGLAVVLARSQWARRQPAVKMTASANVTSEAARSPTAVPPTTAPSFGSAATPTRLPVAQDAPTPTTLAVAQDTPAPTRASAPIARPPVGVWREIEDLPEEVLCWALDPSDAQVVYAGATGAIYRSADAGATWTPLAGSLPNEDVIALAVSPTDPGTLLAVVGVRKPVYRSQDGGATWTLVGTATDTLGGFTHQMLFSPVESQTIYYLAAAERLTYSPNLGETWLAATQGLPMGSHDRVDVLSLALDSVDASIVYAGTGGFVGGGRGVYRSGDGGLRFVPANKGMLDARITALAVDPVHPEGLYAGTDKGILYHSADGGQNWSDLSAGFKGLGVWAPRQIREIVVDPADSARLFLLADAVGPLFSSDGGLTWISLGKPVGQDQPYYETHCLWASPRLVILADLLHGPPMRYAQTQ